MWPELPQNEDLTMRLAATCGIEVPLHGLIYAKDRSLTYFIQRFDRFGRADKRQLEDFAQLAARTRDTKYDFSMERLVPIINSYCTFPAIERQKLFQRTLFNFLVGNEDMHLKNFSLLTRDGVVALAPAYDFLNSTIVLKNPVEIALPLNGRQRDLTRRELVDYWGRERLELSYAAVEDTLSKIGQGLATWAGWIEKSFLSSPMRISYGRIVAHRRTVLAL
jgi:serine/threonine-protein kinase HipA